MAMKVINKQMIVEKEYVNHTILEKEILSAVRLHVKTLLCN